MVEQCRRLQEAVGVNVNADPHFRAPFQPGQPVANDILDIERPIGVNEKPLAVPPSEHGERRWRRPEHRHPLDAGSALTDPASGEVYEAQVDIPSLDDVGSLTVQVAEAPSG